MAGGGGGMLPPINLRDINIPIDIGDIQISLVNVTNAHYEQMPEEAYDRLEDDKADIALATSHCQSRDELEDTLKEEYGQRLGYSDKARELASRMAHETAEDVYSQTGNI